MEMENFLTKDDLVLSLQKEAEGVVKKRLKLMRLVLNGVLVIILFFILNFNRHIEPLVINSWLVFIVFSSLLIIFMPVSKIKQEWVTNAFYELSVRRATESVNKVKIYYQKLLELQNEIRSSDEILTLNEVNVYLERLEEQLEKICELQIETQFFKEILSENLKKIGENLKYN